MRFRCKNSFAINLRNKYIVIRLKYLCDSAQHLLIIHFAKNDPIEPSSISIFGMCMTTIAVNASIKQADVLLDRLPNTDILVKGIQHFSTHSTDVYRQNVNGNAGVSL